MKELILNKNLTSLIFSKNLVQYTLHIRVLLFSWLAYEITKEDLWVGIIMGVGSSPVILTSLLGSYLSERFNINKILLLSYLFIFFLFTLFFIIDYKNIYNLFFLSILFGFISGVPTAPFWTLLINVFGKNNLSKINSYYHMLMFFGEMAMPFIFGFLVSSFNISFVIVFACFLLILGIVLIIFYPADNQIKLKQESKNFDSYFTILKKKPVVFWGTLIVAVQSIFGVTLFIVLPHYSDLLGIGAKGFGFMNGSLGTGLFLGTFCSIYTGVLRSKLLTWIISTIVWDIGQLIFAFSFSYSLSIVTLFFMGFSAAYWTVAANLIFQNETTENDRNKIMGLLTLVMSLFFVGWLVGGVISNLTNAKIALIISALSSYPIFIIAIISSKKLRIV